MVEAVITGLRTSPWRRPSSQARLGRDARLVALVVCALAVSCANALAHRLDEILQSAFLSIDTERLHVELHLTPGIDTFAALAPTLDPDGDGDISLTEAHAFGESVRTNLYLSLDGQRLSLEIEHVKSPDLDALKDGTGTLTFLLSAPTALSPARHELIFRNHDRPGQSVYLANALQPELPDVIQISGQRRSSDQREITVSFERRIAATTTTAMSAAASSGRHTPGPRGWHFLFAAAAGAWACARLARPQRARNGALAGDY